MSELIESYRLLVGALLDHTQIEHGATSPAIADFLASDDGAAADMLRALLAAQDKGYWVEGPGS